MSLKDIFSYQLVFGNLTNFEPESSVPEKRKQFIKCVNFTVDQDLCYISVTNWSCPFFQLIFFSFTLTTFFYPSFVMWLKSSKWYMPKKKIISHFPNILEMFKRMNFCKNRSQSVCYISNDTNYSMNFFSFCVIILIFKSFYGVCLVYIILTLFCCRECYSHPW